MTRRRVPLPDGIAPPKQPPKTARELESERRLAESFARLEVLTNKLHQNNLNTAVRLAQQAARGDGALVEHFAELGRRFHYMLEEEQTPAFKVVDGVADKPRRGAQRRLA